MTEQVVTRRTFLAGSLGVAGLVLVACGPFGGENDDPYSTVARPAKGEWPNWVNEADPEIQTYYRYIAANPEMAKWFPCYCGCGVSGHTSIHDCYVREYRDDGSIVLDDHGFG